MATVDQQGIPARLVRPDAEQRTRAAKDRSGVRFTSNICGSIYLIADVFCLAAGGPLSMAVYEFLFGGRLKVQVHLFAYVVIVCSFLFIRASKNAYRVTLTSSADDSGALLLDACVSTLLGSAVVWQFGLIAEYSRGVTVLFLVILSAFLVLSRPLVRLYLKWLAKRGAIEQRIAFYGADLPSLDLISQVLSEVRLPHLRFVGVADDRPKVSPISGFEFVGGCAELAQLARRGEVDQILIAVPNLPRQRLHDIVDQLSEVSVDVSLIPSEAIELAPDYRVRLLGGLPVLNLWQRPFRDLNGLVKRSEDILLGGAALLALGPLMALGALLVRLSSPGPVLFVQPRFGFNNELIHVFKFRTMYTDQTDLYARSTTTRDDPRVTPVGRVLRRLSIDELPQLLNVLKGDMSIVGPRPHPLEMKVGDLYYQDAVRGYAGRHRVRPGITGLAQVRGLRGEIRTLERAKKRVEFDKEYIENWSIGLDFRILLATVKAVFFDSDAY